MKTRDLHDKVIFQWRTHTIDWVAKEYWRLYDSASGHSSEDLSDTSSKHSSALMHCLLSLSAGMQQLGVVLLEPQKRDEVTREVLYSLAEKLADPTAKHVSETWHRSNLLFVRKMLDAWDPTWSRATGTWKTRLEELTSVCFTASIRHNPLISSGRTTQANRLNHSSLTYSPERKYCWRSCFRHNLGPSIRLLRCYASASLQVDRNINLL